jgi:putative acetyltransferase
MKTDMSDEIHLEHIESGPAIDDIRALFFEYARGLNFNLCFQNFDTELVQLPGIYGMPHGRLVLCCVNAQPVGCIALKPLEPGICEMKRLFVRPEFRGRGLGLKLTRHIISEARTIGYTAMRLDTIKGTMDNAIALYESVGFKEIPAYYNNPIPNAFYMELRL